jgi:hypothetical protein
MVLPLRSKQIFALITFAVFTLLVIVFVVVGATHMNLFQASCVHPDAFFPWF